MSTADDRISMDGLARLIGGPTGSMPEIAQRLKKYESEGLVKPELRKVPMVLPSFAVRSFAAPNLFGGRPTGTRTRDAWHESQRSAGLPPLKPVREPLMHDASFYGPDDAKAIAPREREIAPLRSEFCRFAWDSEVDPAAVVTPVEVPQKMDGAANERPYVSKKTAVEMLAPYCPTIASILKNASHKDYAWLAPARRKNGLKGWHLDPLLGLLVDKRLAEPDSIAKLKEESTSTVVTLESAMRGMSRARKNTAG